MDVVLFYWGAAWSTPGSASSNIVIMSRELSFQVRNDVEKER